MQIKIEDGMINKFQLANRENIQKMEIIRSEISSSIDSLENGSKSFIDSLENGTKSLKDDNKSFRVGRMWDRVLFLLGCAILSAAIYFGLTLH